ncbi:MAG: M23 family metallopeptidase, partial [Clostridiales bacterium]|nr:M23 family metallopeptidase [Clostridiales bacterium]
TVLDSDYDESYGNYIKLDHGDNIVTIYAHCSSLCVAAGDEVSQGDIIAKVGSTGSSTGNHLHFEMRKDNIRINPAFALYGGDV